MISIFKKKLSPETISTIKEQVISELEYEQYDLAFKSIQPLIKAQSNNEFAAESLIEIVEDGNLDVNDALDILNEVYESHQQNIRLVSSIGSALEYARNIDELNLPPPEHPLFEAVIQTLVEATNSGYGDEEEVILVGLSTATRMMARQHDELSLDSYRRLVDMHASDPANHYCLGLLCKTRGLFREGMESNKKGLELLEEPRESYLWNLGICATGAGDGETALNIWKQIGNKIEMGRFNLPEGGYPSCKVKLAEFPLAERSAGNDYPGQQETIWIERLSPCHGIIRSVLYQDLGVDYGDVVLIDGAPVTYHKYGDNEIPVFPHLSTLIRRDYQFFDFVATQEERGQIGAVSESLSSDSVVYVHTENFKILCSTCWRDPNNDHSEHTSEEKCIVRGRIAAAKTVESIELLKEIDTEMEQLQNCEIFAPLLCKQSGFDKRADVEQRRYNLLTENM
ncbi:hypothetical protein Q4490_02900 [Neptunomonas phycophila]|uniref:Tetratricopeptide repeat protein n=1 Tax=Neptunomonas phycophila TaxID=1572645 RepID=A0AAW7XE70_9GAMM|nr:hypothetical protein [Neptunomonas phycophila]MDO6452504.1 hypothetical protein [Neptunomonas phycophila]